MEEHLTRETQGEVDNRRELDNLKKVEATLFVAGKFLSEQELVALTNINPILLNKALDELKEKYNEESAIEIISKGDLWKMGVKNEYRGIVNRLATGNEEFTRAEQETLAIIAHKQPITQSKIIQVRGNKAYEHIRKFVDLGLVNSKKSGRTRELNLSEEFYDYFSVIEKQKVFENDKEKDSVLDSSS